MTPLIEADRALFESGGAIIAAVHENERPLAGLSGLLDWRFHGIISLCLRAGAITGKPGECAYLPITKAGKTYRILLTGAGKSARPGERSILPQESLRALRKNLLGLKLPSVVASRKDFGNPPEDYFEKHWKDIPLRVAL